MTSRIELKHPNNSKESQSFMGMINYLYDHISNLSEIMIPFRILLKNDIKLKWSIKQQESFEKLKKYYAIYLC